MVQATNMRASATMAPSNHSRSRTEVPREEVKKAMMPAPASGTAPRKPTSAADGYGTATPIPTSYTDQATSPIPHARADADGRAQPSLWRPLLRLAASAQQATATNAATASPMSSTAIVMRSPPIRNAVHTTKPATTTTVPAAAQIKTLPSRAPPQGARQSMLTSVVRIVRSRSAGVAVWLAGTGPPAFRWPVSAGGAQAAAKPLPARGREPAFGQPQPEGAPADREQKAANHIARPVGARPDPRRTPEHDHDGGHDPGDPTQAGANARRHREREHEADPREKHGVPTRVAVARRGGKDVNEVGGWAVSLQHDLDLIVEQARDGADGHEPATAAVPDEDEYHGGNSDRALRVTGGHVHQVQDVGDGAPRKALDPDRDRYVERQQRLGGDQVGVHREHNRDGDGERTQPHARAWPGPSGDDLFGGLLGTCDLAHRGSSSLTTGRGWAHPRLPRSRIHLAAANECSPRATKPSATTPRSRWPYGWLSRNVNAPLKPRTLVGSRCRPA